MLKLSCNKRSLKIIIVVYHLLFTILSWLYLTSIFKENDPDRFYRIAQSSSNWLDLFGVGSKFITFLIYPLVKLKIPLFMISLVFSLIGLKGFLLFIDILFKGKYIDDKNTNLFALIIFLLMPTLHFWTSFISKDAILFYLMMYVLYYLFHNENCLLKLIVVAFLILMIRPYIFAILLTSYSIYYVYVNTFNFKKSIFFLCCMTGLFLLLFPILQKFLKLDNLNLLSFKTNFNQLVLYSQTNGNSSIDLLNSSYFDRLILLLFKPFIFEALGYKQIFVAIENSIIWIVLIRLFIRNITLKFQKLAVYPLMTVLFLILFYSIYMYNMGLASRMRVMFLPYLFFVLFWNIFNKPQLSIK